MKKIKILLFVVLLSCFSISCDVDKLLDRVSEKTCEIGVREIKDEYNDQINVIKNDTNLTQEQIDEKIAALIIKRDEEIKTFEMDCSF